MAARQRIALQKIKKERKSYACKLVHQKSIKLTLDQIRANFVLILDSNLFPPKTLSSLLGKIPLFQSNLSHHESSSNQYCSYQHSTINPISKVGQLRKKENLSDESNHEEIEKQKADETAATSSDHLAGIKKDFDVLYMVADVPFLEPYKLEICDLIRKAETQPNLIIGVVVSIVVIFISLLLTILFGGKKPAATATSPASQPVVQEASNTKENTKEEKQR